MNSQYQITIKINVRNTLNIRIYNTPHNRETLIYCCNLNCLGDNLNLNVKGFIVISITRKLQCM